MQHDFEFDSKASEVYAVGLNVCRQCASRFETVNIRRLHKSFAAGALSQSKRNSSCSTGIWGMTDKVRLLTCLSFDIKDNADLEPGLSGIGHGNYFRPATHTAS